jgi:hypothetical protein
VIVSQVVKRPFVLRRARQNYRPEYPVDMPISKRLAHNSGVSKSRCRACQAFLSSLSGVLKIGLNESADFVRWHGFREQVSLG